MSPRLGLSTILAISVSVQLGAYGFEHIGGLAPCKLCYYQRIPYGMAIMVSLLALLRPDGSRYALPVLACIYAASTGLGIYHAGVEWKWWPGPDSCTGSAGNVDSVEELMAQLMATPVVQCDEIPWSLFGISLAGYNTLISLALVGFILLMLRKPGLLHDR